MNYIFFYSRPNGPTWDVRQFISFLYFDWPRSFFQTLDNKWGYLLKIRVVLSGHFFISGRCAGMMGSGGMCTTFNVFLSDHFVIVSVLLNRVASGGQLMAYFLSNALRLSLFIGFFKKSWDPFIRKGRNGYFPFGGHPLVICLLIWTLYEFFNTFYFLGPGGRTWSILFGCYSQGFIGTISF